MPSRKVKEYLEKAGIGYDVLEHDVVYTAQEVAALTHVKGEELAKAVLVKADGEMLMAVLPATRKLDFPLLKKALGKKNVSLASEEEFSPLFPDCELGAAPPLGKLYNMKMIVDDSLGEDEEIVFNAGTHHDIIKISYKDYERLEQPKMAAIAAHG